MQPIRVLIQASDPVKRAGIVSLLRSAEQIDILTEGERATADVLVLAEHSVGAAQLDGVRRMRAGVPDVPGPRCVVITDRFDKQDTLFAVQCGVSSILPAEHCTAARLVVAVVGATKGHSMFPRGLQSALLNQLHDLRENVLEPNGLTLSGFARRELDTIRLIADGFRTDEIASKLSCSEGTVKNVLRGAMQRLGLANRTHAVAYAIQSGALV
ncbi:LuxR C-terminal-related transcriptional regulator [Amycolatopsis sp. NPDC059021]|uniref:LuxR C-terminal-related transcriptional regulator n=1 Tax=Amycolatopsis sp. NPDC059021 TaxID=3346704 RepID=UPI0036705BCE